MNRYTALYFNLKCWLGIHTEAMIDKSEDPFQGLPGHIATSHCTWCDMHRRYLGYPDDVRFVMPWVGGPMVKDDD